MALFAHEQRPETGILEFHTFFAASAKNYLNNYISFTIIANECSKNKMKIYLDNCCYNRPYDKTPQLIVELEARAKLAIQKAVQDGKYELVSSEVLLYEIQRHPMEMTKTAILSFVEENASYHVGAVANVKIHELAMDIMKQGIHYKDACHVASALYAGCEFFLTTDKRLLKYSTDEINMCNPIDFIREMENLND